MIEVGDTVGDYLVEGLLGRGGMGVVYRARNITAGHAVAIKALRPDLAESPKAVQRFFREIAAVRSVTHPNVVRFLDTGLVANGQGYIVFELLEGQTLRSLIGAGQPMDGTWVVHLIAQLARGLDAVHAGGIVHRDINPANIFLARNRPGLARVVIIDFGIAKLGDSIVGLSSERVELGTLTYRAPEQEHDNRAVSLRADIYALGVTTFELFAGVSPWGWGPSVEVLGRKRLDPTPHLRGMCPALSAQQAEVIQWAMAHDDMKRCESASVFADAFAAASNVTTATPDYLDVLLSLAGSPPDAPTTPVPTTGAPPSAARRR